MLRTFQHLPHPGFALAVSAVLLCSVPGGVILADPPATPAEVPSAPSGSFMSSLKQAFTQDFDHEVVRGHFDVGAAPDTHRYYCLVDPKTGKSEANGVAGELVPRHDKMTAIKGAAVSFFSCTDAERKGILVTAPYVLSAQRREQACAAARARCPLPRRWRSPAAPAISLAASAAAPAAALRLLLRRKLRSWRSIRASSLARTLTTARSFLRCCWIQAISCWPKTAARSIWGRKQALDAFEAEWKGSWKVDPQTQELRIADIAPGVEMLITPLLLTHGEPGKSTSSVPQRWAGVFVKTKSGWRIASIFITPYESWRAPKAD